MHTVMQILEPICVDTQAGQGPAAAAAGLLSDALHTTTILIRSMWQRCCACPRHHLCPLSSTVGHDYSTLCVDMHA
jgi:hypothetical protein